MSVDRSSWWTETTSLAVVFGLVSVPWTYAFVAGDVPLWPSFVASAAVFAGAREGVGSDGSTASEERCGRQASATQGLFTALPAMLAGIAYAAATLAIVDAAGGGTLVLAFVVGAFMLLASLHAGVSALSYTPAGFLGYASLFGVHAAGTTVFGLGGLVGVTAATALAVAVGAHVGWGAAVASDRLS